MDELWLLGMVVLGLFLLGLALRLGRSASRRVPVRRRDGGFDVEVLDLAGQVWRTASVVEEAGALVCRWSDHPAVRAGDRLGLVGREPALAGGRTAYRTRSGLLVATATGSAVDRRLSALLDDTASPG